MPVVDDDFLTRTLLATSMGQGHAVERAEDGEAAEITESDYFRQLQERARSLRDEAEAES